jgi:hypothetical protein
MLDNDDLDADMAASKIKHRFPDELQDAAQCGKLQADLWEFLNHLCTHSWAIDVHEQEGCNSMLKRMGSIAPGIQVELLSARLCIKKYLHRCTKAESLADATKDERETIVQACVESHSPVAPSVSAQRWAMVDPSDYPPVPNVELPRVLANSGAPERIRKCAVGMLCKLSDFVAEAVLGKRPARKMDLMPSPDFAIEIVSSASSSSSSSCTASGASTDAFIFMIATRHFNKCCFLNVGLMSKAPMSSIVQRVTQLTKQITSALISWAILQSAVWQRLEVWFPVR